MADLDQLLRSGIAHTAAAAVEPPDFARIMRRGVQRRRAATLRTAAAAAGVVVLVALGGSWALAGGDDASLKHVDQPPPSSPWPTGWTGPLREGGAGAPLSMRLRDEFGDRVRVRGDGRDATLGGIDIVEVEAGGFRRLQWGLRLRGDPPGVPSGVGRRVVEFGVVVDADGDRAADCHIGINDDTPRPGDYRVWVRNLRTGTYDERVGGPYGIPIDFAHPEENPDDPERPRPRPMQFFFLQDTRPCDPFRAAAAFYTYASVQDDGRVTDWDYAPDAGWLSMPEL